MPYVFIPHIDFSPSATDTKGARSGGLYLHIFCLIFLASFLISFGDFASPSEYAREVKRQLPPPPVSVSSNKRPIFLSSLSTAPKWKPTFSSSSLSSSMTIGSIGADFFDFLNTGRDDSFLFSDFFLITSIASCCIILKNFLNESIVFSFHISKLISLGFIMICPPFFNMLDRISTLLSLNIVKGHPAITIKL